MKSLILSFLLISFSLASFDVKSGGCDAHYTIVGDSVYCPGDTIHLTFRINLHGPDCNSYCNFLFGWYKNGTLILSDTSRSFTPTDTGFYNGSVLNCMCYGPCGGHSQIVHVIYDGCTSLTNIPSSNAQQDEIQIFPNPTQGLFAVNASSATKQIQIFDSYGHLMLTKIVNVEGKLNFELLNNGIYFIHVITCNYAYVRKLVVYK